MLVKGACSQLKIREAEKLSIGERYVVYLILITSKKKSRQLQEPHKLSLGEVSTFECTF